MVVSYDDLRVVKCACGYVFMNPYLTEEGSRMIFSGKMAEIFPWLQDFDKVLDVVDSKSNTLRAYEKALDWLEQWNKKGRILDIGCGGGHFLAIAKKRGWEGVGLDFSRENVASAVKRTGFPVYLGKADEIKTKEKAFDVIAMWDYLEHIENPKQTLEQLRKMLNPAGVVVVACPNHRSLLFWSALALKGLPVPVVGKAVKMLYPATHLSYFEPNFLAKQMEDIGYRTVNVQYDETDFNRVPLSAPVKMGVTILFAVARFFQLNNRFILFLQRND